MKVREFLVRDDFRFVKKEVLCTIAGYPVNTKIDAHGHKMTLDALKSIKTQLENKPWRFDTNHNSKCPTGIIQTDSLEIREMEGGEHGLWVEVDVIDQNTKDMIDREELKAFSIGATISSPDIVDKKYE